ncbi:hypothetical protein GR215_33020 [Rhizobium leguminosarum]|uniref:hypothetical protein n=1 Tax=Rhizobium leguminosarum TaxID=384 RepID=UPI0013BB833B|nr:hypothetical protein [Rhizobium leguminosarum]NEH46624.1 hypothetical protein [Rhizobium leguminosarum]
MSERQSRLCSHLAEFSSPLLVQMLAGLLTHPDNQPASIRIEALIHLAALHCRGDHVPSPGQIREWLNDILLSDPLGAGETPVEDVFASVVPSPSGSALLLEGTWRDNAYCLQNMMAALLRLSDEPWAAAAMRHVMSLLQVSHEMAARAGVRRYTMSTGEPGARIMVSSERLAQGARSVRFRLQDIFSLGLIARDIAPFVLDATDYPRLATDILGNSTLERQPLIRAGHDWIVALPTAIGAAARQFIMESAKHASALPQLQAALTAVELQEIYQWLLPSWEMTAPSEVRSIGRQVHAVRAQFDVGAYALIVLVSDDLTEAMRTGLNASDTIPDATCREITRLEAELAARGDFRRGLTIVVRGGVGRGYMMNVRTDAAAWQHADLELGDAVRMGRDGPFTAKRVWKLLARRNEIASQGLTIVNAGGFLNLYGYLQTRQFDYAPEGQPLTGLVMISADFAARVRSDVRNAIDYHLALGPDARRLVEVERRSTTSYFREVRELPLFVAPQQAGQGRLLAVVETANRSWWVEYQRARGDQPELTMHIWDAAQQWLVRLAPILEDELADLAPGPLKIELYFPDIQRLAEEALFSDVNVERPAVSIAGTTIRVASSVSVLRGYVNATNIAERYLIAAMAIGTSRLTGASHGTDWGDALATRITGSEDARFVHAKPAEDVAQMLQSTVHLPKSRFVLEEDRAWSFCGLAKLVGGESSGAVLASEVGPLLHSAVAYLWERIRNKLQEIDRRSIVEMALLNHEAIDKDRSDWAHTAAALLALHRDREDVLRTHNEQEGMRASAGVASRALAEMAICTSPPSSGRICSQIDFDEMLADASAMVDCATQCDAYYYRLARTPLAIAPDGSFIFDTGFLEELHLPYMHAHGNRAFHDAAEAYGDAFAESDLPEVGDERPILIDTELTAAIVAEFGMTMEDLVDLSHKMLERALQLGRPILTLRRSEVLAILAEMGPAIAVDRAFTALTLMPRPEWNKAPAGHATNRDWQPWRMNRRLSLTRRPWIQLTEEADPDILISPVLTDRVIRRIFDLIDGRVGSEMFDTKQIDRWMGKIVNDRGHAFNHAVADSLVRSGYEALPDQLMTRFGGKKDLGDVDVLAWEHRTNTVWIIECKRLLLDRTVAEVGERLADYTTRGRRNGKRTPIQKHLDRVDFLRGHPDLLAKATSIPLDRLVIRSALITDRIVPMQFATTMNSLVDRVCDYRQIEALFGTA